MARVLVAAVGSRGDVQPMLALAVALREAGHGVRACTPPDFAPARAALDLEGSDVGFDMQAWLAERKARVTRPFAVFREADGFIKDQIDGQALALARAAEGADLLLGAGMLLGGRTAADVHGIPYRYVAYTPQALPSPEHPVPFLPWQRLPRWVNALSHRLLTAVWKGGILGRIEARRAAFGLAPAGDVFDAVVGREVWLACDPALAPAPRSLLHPARVIQIGALLFPSQEPVPAALAEFVAAGPTVYLGFGSMPDARPGATMAAFAEACGDLGVQAIYCSGWTVADPGARARHVRVVPSAPHAALFPRLSALVHHGGAGTFAVASRSGVPQVVVPHLYDQFFWAERAFRAGIGPPPFPKRRLNQRRLAASLAACLEDPRLPARAREVAASLAAGDGCRRAVEEVARVLSGA